MKRHPALADLSRDHHHALVHAKTLTQTPDEDTAQTNAQRYIDHWNDAVEWHFIEEELTILPILQRHIPLPTNEHVQRMITDHAWIRDQTQHLIDHIDQGNPIKQTLLELGERLREHARFEDRELFPYLEKTLTDDELHELHDRSKRFRREHRGPDSIGPKTSRGDET